MVMMRTGPHEERYIESIKATRCAMMELCNPVPWCMLGSLKHQRDWQITCINKCEVGQFCMMDRDNVLDFESSGACLQAISCSLSSSYACPC